LANTPVSQKKRRAASLDRVAQVLDELIRDPIVAQEAERTTALPATMNLVLDSNIPFSPRSREAMGTTNQGAMMPFLPRVSSLLPICFMACLTVVFGNPALAEIPPLAKCRLPQATEEVKLDCLVKEAHARFKDVTKGKNVDYIPSLAKVDSNLFGVAIVTVKGEVYVAGDSDHEFTIQSISKLFTLALVLQDHGEDAILERIVVEPTGMPFISIAAVEMHQSARNPLVNAGAITAISLVKATSKDERWKKIQHTYKTFEGSQSNLNFNQEVYESEAETNQRNHSIAKLLFGYGLLHADPLDTVDVYTKQCSINVTTTQLAKMGRYHL
jgi:glutaminase